VRGNHAKIAARPLFERIETGFEVANLGAELPIALLELLVLIALCDHGFLESIQLAHTILGEPNPVLQEEDDEC